MRSIKIFIIAFAVFCTSKTKAADINYLPTPGKVAFIGNSLTLTNNGSDLVVKRLADSMAPPLQLTIDNRVQTGGYYLSAHWADSAKKAIIVHGGFNMVVLQEGGDLTYSTSQDDANQFFQYAKLWADTIRSAGATPALYMMWAWREDTGAAMAAVTDHQAVEYDSAARLIHAKVIPIGRGYYKLRHDTSAIAKNINLFNDYQHPTCCATYFIGCVCFSALYNISPAGNSYLGADMSGNQAAPASEQARFMQKVAWETWQEYGGDDSGRGYVSSNAALMHKPVFYASTYRTLGRQSAPYLTETPTIGPEPRAFYLINGARINLTLGNNYAARKFFRGILVSVCRD